MGGFVAQYPVLRWGIAAGFVIAAVLVAGRLPVFAHGVVGGASRPVADHESDAAHLLMCLVMLAMLVFPMVAAPDALRGVLTAMTVVYAAVLAARVWAWRNGDCAPARAATIGYHLIAATAMLWSMSGHGMSMSMDRPPAGSSVPMLVFAALFVLDAVLMFVPGPISVLRHTSGHAMTPAAVIPHVVMDLGTAYMLAAAALH
ncbi:DUF5134 domain-containing protein [Nocardia jiangxiensis]|uniref:DUF5134 domain-containing protein n=1 Tax=Nocardia jiangxiensis TaxID=282685 RepID=A0ABW6S7U7_9NOCA|nr:DUF5134 domain-containing protein [Nocardia jiangxiensis]